MNFYNMRLRQIQEEIAYEYAPEAFVENFMEPFEKEGGEITEEEIAKARMLLEYYLEYLDGQKDDIQFKVDEFNKLLNERRNKQ